jgi:hypothetical protein
MNRHQILSLMMRKEHQVIDANLYSVAALMAERLAQVSDKLIEAETYDFIHIGAAIYRHGVNEFGAGILVDDLFPAEQDWMSKDQWH